VYDHRVVIEVLFHIVRERNGRGKRRKVEENSEKAGWNEIGAECANILSCIGSRRGGGRFKPQVQVTPWVSFHTARILTRLVTVPLAGTVCHGKGKVWENLTRGIPVLNPDPRTMNA
jgi:hypothetical protein